MKPAGELESIHINLRINKQLWKKIHRLAITEETSISLLVNEALTQWLKWIMKAEQDELSKVKKIKEDDLKEYQKEILETQKLIEEFRREKIKLKHLQFKKETGKGYSRGPYKKKSRNAIEEPIRKPVKKEAAIEQVVVPEEKPKKKIRKKKEENQSELLLF